MTYRLEGGRCYPTELQRLRLPLNVAVRRLHYGLEPWRVELRLQRLEAVWNTLTTRTQKRHVIATLFCPLLAIHLER